MLTSFDRLGSKLVARPGTSPVSPETIWIDLHNPGPDEDAFVEKQLAIDIPTRAETREIEASNRLYQENGAHYMTAFVLHNIDALLPAGSTVTFVLAGQRLVTIRYADMRSFPLYCAQVEKGDAGCQSATAIMMGLIETMISRSADLVEKLQDDVERNAQSVFEIKGGQQTRNRRLDVLLKAVGREGDINSRAQESALSLDRLLTYLSHVLRDRGGEATILERIDTAQRDLHALREHMHFLANRITFLLDATLGMISIEQNAIIKIFSVASVALMPPTLIASIYGMNFKHMPELDLVMGYPAALCLMVLSAVIPFLYFRRKGWF